MKSQEMPHAVWDENEDGYYERWEIDELEPEVILERQEQDGKLSQQAHVSGRFIPLLLGTFTIFRPNLPQETAAATYFV